MTVSSLVKKTPKEQVRILSIHPHSVPSTPCGKVILQSHLSPLEVLLVGLVLHQERRYR